MRQHSATAFGDFLWREGETNGVGQTCLCARLFKNFRLWSPNGWDDRDGCKFTRCAGTSERRCQRFQTDRLHVARAMCDRTNSCKKVVAQGAGQAKGRIRLKLCMSIAKLSGQLPLGSQRRRPLGTCNRHVPNDFMNSFIATERLVQLVRERYRSTGTDGGKTALSVKEGSWVRILPGREINLRF